MSSVKMEDNEEEDKEGEELDRTVVVNDSPTKSLSKADYADEENATTKKKSFTPINATMNERMKKLFSKENREIFAKNAKETTFKAGTLLQDVSSKSFVKMKESVQKMKELSVTKKNADENENDDDAKAKKRVERGIRASTTETNNNADIFLDVEDDLRFLGYADGDHATLAKVTVMKWSVMFPRCLAVGREDGTIRVIVFGSKNGMDNRAKNKKKEKNKEAKEATSEKRAATNDISQQQKEEEEEGNEKKQHKKGGSVADRVASIEKEQKQEEGRDGASTPPPPTTEIILSDDEDEEKMDEYNAHGVSHVFELEDVFTEAVSDLDWSLDGSALLACSAKGKEIRMYKLNDNNSGNTNNATKYFRSGTLEAVVQISENPRSVKIHPVRTNLALITTKQRSVMLADVNSSQPPDRVRVQGDRQAPSGGQVLGAAGPVLRGDQGVAEP